MNSQTPLLGLRGCVIDAPEYGKLRSWRDGAVVIAEGRILEVGSYQFIGRKHRPQPIHWQQSDRAVIFPGLIDLHTHLPQYPVVARGRGQLLEWLHQQIFPRERGFTGAVADREAKAFFGELARHGTTTAAVYTAIYEDSCDAAFHAAAGSGLRVIMGQTMMDVGTYGTLQARKILSVTLQESERLCRKWHGEADGLLEYAFSPRFALACSERLMRAAGEMAREFGCHIQTHLAENREECERVRHLFPKSADYTDVYEKAGLLGPRTILGHCIHLSPRERAAHRGDRHFHRALPDGEPLPLQRNHAARRASGGGHPDRPRHRRGRRAGAEPLAGDAQRHREPEGAQLLRAGCRRPHARAGPAPRHAGRGGGARKRGGHRQPRSRERKRT